MVDVVREEQRQRSGARILELSRPALRMPVEVEPRLADHGDRLRIGAGTDPELLEPLAADSHAVGDRRRVRSHRVGEVHDQARDRGLLLHDHERHAEVVTDIGCGADVEEQVGRGHERVEGGAHELLLEDRPQPARVLAALGLVLGLSECLQPGRHLGGKDA